ncbi:hypothetical protein Poli38472_014787 [Pythium oligandrum]|uniref:Uncharacterized protein n=1 Tax=Pythium oligandrum TaxID=41045 RepID=A0A8K1CI76_PYTOL|nr:hypothetical protein Poli38472_014787 [Pythium oligandrum]|eukprot:TMW63877.1 hypothetical protein Poli38472_014787 [Pythium oligandrum]
MASASTVKAFIAQVHAAASASQRLTPTIHGIDCSRFWLQGVVVSLTPDENSCVIDDGTGVVTIDMKTFRKSIPAGMVPRVTIGDLIMVIGPLQRRTGATQTDPDSKHAVLAHQVMPLADQPEQEAIWFLEVTEFWNMLKA